MSSRPSARSRYAAVSSSSPCGRSGLPMWRGAPARLLAPPPAPGRATAAPLLARRLQTQASARPDAGERGRSRAGGLGLGVAPACRADARSGGDALASRLGGGRRLEAQHAVLELAEAQAEDVERVVLKQPPRRAGALFGELVDRPAHVAGGEVDERLLADRVVAHLGHAGGVA